MSEQKLDARVLTGERPLTAQQRLDHWRRDWDRHQLDELIEAVDRLDLELDKATQPRRG